MTIEEAWKALNYVGAQKEEIAASKALALAVLIDVVSPGGRKLPPWLLLKAEAVHRRISALGVPE